MISPAAPPPDEPDDAVPWRTAYAVTTPGGEVLAYFRDNDAAVDWACDAGPNFRVEPLDWPRHLVGADCSDPLPVLDAMVVLATPRPEGARGLHEAALATLEARFAAIAKRWRAGGGR